MQRVLDISTGPHLATLQTSTSVGVFLLFYGTYVKLHVNYLEISGTPRALKEARFRPPYALQSTRKQIVRSLT